MRPRAAGPARPWSLALLTVALLLGAAGGIQGALTHSTDGRSIDWDGQDVVAAGSLAARPGAALELRSLMADENGTHWFFAVNYTALRAPDNDTLALYFFAGNTTAAPVDPRGLQVALPAGSPLVFVLYIDLDGPLPGASELTYADSGGWKNRTLQELGVQAARNDSVGLLEVSAPRDTLLFLAAGGLVAVLFDGNGTALDAVPDLVGQPASVSEAAPFFDYTFHPPIAFTAIGFSDPGAADGQPVLFFLQLTNQGPKTAEGVSAQVVVDDEVFGAREGLTLLPGGTAIMNFSWTARAGLHNFTATSFPGGAQRTISALFAGAAAVLVVDSVRSEPHPATAGADFQVIASVRNTGKADSREAELLLKDGTRVIGRAAVPALAPGASTNVTFGVLVEETGSKALRVEVNGVNTPGSARDLDVSVVGAPPAVVLPLEAVALLAMAAFGVAMWFLTPRLLRERPGRP